MKKLLSLGLVSLCALTLTACGGQVDSSKNESSAVSKTTDSVQQTDKKDSAEAPKKNKIYAQDEWWEVPGQWKLKINSIRKTDNRNSYSDKTPAEVVIINYSYENLGYEKTIQDLYMTVSNVIDESGTMGQTYPSTDTSSALTPTPIGAKCEGAEAAFGLTNTSTKLKVNFSKYDSNSNSQNATFEIPVN
ncbi:hypothetical protein AB6887_05000 [Carnobacterium divergens]|uniref:hypothetical protein n=1 Tax=Carnobacterium divergens TaxID=2748 RepID=UPI001071934D|nr:hypothetical protein [Carnobacterium divergens]TFI67835.1 hypothetical protein CKN59_03235 [Carnobacterium divergens]TFI67881.1 hypothetical protein CKN76_03310 [Carnobacterium divergens]TFI82781.1 hypothetical protein CKN74_03275 [Carnobacterium divergens]TFJ08902.1 hypothetical protein CKN75_03305 [Carnobacterium divergens]TFJ14036.1 hypothetical protein CKN71_03305 [Carnobacterium divergens]